MNAIEFYHEDQRPAGVFYCGVCRIVAQTEEQAERCCAPKKCQFCQTEIPKENYYSACGECREEKEAEKEAARFEAAGKVTSYDGWIFCHQEYGYQDGYFESVEALREWLEGEEELETPAYVWTCKPNKFAEVFLDSIMQSIAEASEAYEDFDTDDLDGCDELAAAIDAFNKANEGICSWSADYKCALLIEPEADEPEEILVSSPTARDTGETPVLLDDHASQLNT